MVHRLKSTVLHPYLFASFPILFLYTHNWEDLQLKVIVMPMAVALLLVAVFLLSFHMWKLNNRCSGLLVSVLVVLFFSYGHVRNAVFRSLFLRPFGADKVTLGLFLVLFLSSSFWIFKQRYKLEVATVLSNLMGIVLLGLAGINLVAGAYQIMFQQSSLFAKPSEEERSHSSQAPNSYKPDIYYFVLDGYGRADTLKNYYNYSNDEFLAFLESRGFYIATKSRSNYVMTVLSISSSLNFDYIDQLSVRLNRKFSSIESLSETIFKSRIVTRLREMGYKFVAFSTGYDLTSVSDADVYLGPKPMKGFYRLLVDTTAARLILEAIHSDTDDNYGIHRRIIQYSLTEVARLPLEMSPKFVFVHVLAAHPPFVFGPNGEDVQPNRDFGLFDGIGFLNLNGASREEYKTGYKNQLQYCNHLLERSIDDILKKSSGKAIIIVQGDHGPRLEMDWIHAQEPEECLGCYGILNAYHLPIEAAKALYPEISPVNSFRVVGRHCFGWDLDLLQDITYYSTVAHPFAFQETSADKQ